MCARKRARKALVLLMLALGCGGGDESGTAADPDAAVTSDAPGDSSEETAADAALPDAAIDPDTGAEEVAPPDGADLADSQADDVSDAALDTDASGDVGEATLLTSDDGFLTLEVPAGATPDASVITMTALAPESLGEPWASLAAVVHPYRLGPDGLTFAEPVTARLTFSEDDLSSPPQDQTWVWQLVTASSAGDLEVLEPLPPLMDGEGGIAVGARITHFSDLAMAPVSAILLDTNCTDCAGEPGCSSCVVGQEASVTATATSIVGDAAFDGLQGCLKTTLPPDTTILDLDTEGWARCDDDVGGIRGETTEPFLHMSTGLTCLDAGVDEIRFLAWASGNTSPSGLGGVLHTVQCHEPTLDSFAVDEPSALSWIAPDHFGQEGPSIAVASHAHGWQIHAAADFAKILPTFPLTANYHEVCAGDAGGLDAIIAVGASASASTVYLPATGNTGATLLLAGAPDCHAIPDGSGILVVDSTFGRITRYAKSADGDYLESSTAIGGAALGFRTPILAWAGQRLVDEAAIVVLAATEEEPAAVAVGDDSGVVIALELPGPPADIACAPGGPGYICGITLFESTTLPVITFDGESVALVEAVEVDAGFSGIDAASVPGSDAVLLAGVNAVTSNLSFMRAESYVELAPDYLLDCTAPADALIDMGIPPASSTILVSCQDDDQVIRVTPTVPGD